MFMNQSNDRANQLLVICTHQNGAIVLKLDEEKYLFYSKIRNGPWGTIIHLHVLAYIPLGHAETCKIV